MGECLQTHEIGSSLSTITFDPTDSYLLTQVGPITFGLLSSVSQSGDADAVSSAATALATTATCAKEESQESRQYSYRLSSDRSWITWHGCNVLWIPSEYRPSCFTMSGSIVSIGCPSGRVLVISFSPAILSVMK